MYCSRDWSEIVSGWDIPASDHYKHPYSHQNPDGHQDPKFYAADDPDA
jgi:hypothetical protein